MTRSESLRILSTQFTITSNRPELIERLAYVVQRAEHELPLREQCEIMVAFANGEYRISSDGDADETALALPDAFTVLFGRLHDRAMRLFSDHIRIHAASGFGPEGMVLLVGEKEAGKTTTAMHLLLEGFDMVGDELVLLRDGEAVTFPRPFYVRDTALKMLPRFAGHQAAPFMRTTDGGRLVAADLQQFGTRWRIRPAPIRAIFFLEPNHGGSTSFSRCGKIEMVQRMLGQTSPPPSGRAAWMTDFCSAINAAETIVARMGDLQEATPLFGKFLS